MREGHAAKERRWHRVVCYPDDEHVYIKGERSRQRVIIGRAGGICRP